MPEPGPGRQKVFLPEPIVFAVPFQGCATMANRADRERKGAASSGKRRQSCECADERLKLLRLDLCTIMAQIKLLERELDVDLCLSTDGTRTILSLIAALKQELEVVSLHIGHLKGSVAAQTA